MQVSTVDCTLEIWMIERPSDGPSCGHAVNRVASVRRARAAQSRSEAPAWPTHVWCRAGGGLRSVCAGKGARRSPYSSLL